MIIKACFDCKFHEIKKEEEVQMSFCRKERCWSQYTHCIILRAVGKFLNEECVISKNI